MKNMVKKNILKMTIEIQKAFVRHLQFWNYIWQTAENLRALT